MSDLAVTSAGDASPGQARWAWLSKLSANRSLGNVGLVARVFGRVQSAALEKSVQEVMGRHPTLRTSFVREAGAWRRKVTASMATPFTVVDLRDTSNPVARADLAVQRSSTEPFDLAAPPLFRVVLVRVAADRCVLVLVCHRSVADAYALEHVLAEELRVCYAALIKGRAPTLPPVASPVAAERACADLVASLQAQEHEACTPAALKWWRDVLPSQRRTLRLPTLRAFPPEPGHRCATSRVFLAAPLEQRIRSRAAGMGVSEADFFRAVWTTLLARMSGDPVVALGLQEPNRPTSFPDPHAVMFPTERTALVLAAMDPQEPFEALVHRLVAEREAMRAFQAVPLERLDALQGARSRLGSRNPLFQASFSFVSAHRCPLALQGAEVRCERVETGAMLVDIGLVVLVRRSGLELLIDYNPEVFDAAVASSIARRCLALLRTVMRAPETPVGRLGLMDRTERAAVVALGHGPRVPEQAAATVGQFLDLDAVAMDARPALLWGETSWSYAELHRRVVEFRESLRIAGVRPGVAAGVMFASPGDTIAATIAGLACGLRMVLVEAGATLDHACAMLSVSGAALVMVDASTSAVAEHASLPAVSCSGAVVDSGTPGVAEPAAEVEAGLLSFPSCPSDPVEGVELRAKALVEMSAWSRAPRGQQRPILLTLSMSNPAALCTVFGTLRDRGRAVLFDARSPIEPAALGGAIDRHDVGCVWLAATQLDALLRRAPASCLGSLRTVVCAQGVLDPALTRKHAVRLPAATLRHVYVPDPRVGIVAAGDVPLGAEPTVPLGTPVANRRCLVLDAKAQLVATGSAGELYVGGIDARLPETAEPGAAASVIEDEDGPLFRVGARVRFRHDGVLERVSLSTDRFGPLASRQGAPLRTPTERAIASLFSKILQAEDVDAASDFFDLGGHSLQAVALLEALEVSLGVRLALRALFLGSTVRQIAGAIEGAVPESRFRFLQPLVEGPGERTPLFFFGSGAYARSVAAGLRHPRAVYGLNIFGMVDAHGTIPDFDLRSLAARFVGEIRTVQPSGPYFFAAYCGDTKVTYEVAQQLRNAGEAVELLCLIDAPWVLQRHMGMGHMEMRLRRLARNVTAFGGNYLARKAKGRVVAAQDWFERKAALRQHRGAATSTDASPLASGHRALVAVYEEAQDDYVASPYTGRLVVVLSTEWSLPSLAVRALGRASNIELVEVSGYHDEMFKGRQFQVLLARLERLLRGADRRLSARASGRAVGNGRRR